MRQIYGMINTYGGITWENDSFVGSREEEEAETIAVNFPFFGRPPTAHRAEAIVMKDLPAAEGVDWFRVERKRWLVDLAKFKAFFQLPDADYTWLEGTVVVEPRYDVLPDHWKKDEMRGVLSIVIERSSVEPVPDEPWDVYPPADLDGKLPLLK